jgi:uncharacterized protein (TIGR02145 family)
VFGSPRNTLGSHDSAGKAVSITASPSGGYEFVNWTGGQTANAEASATTVAVDSDMVLTANFRKSVSYGYGTLTDRRDGKTYRTIKMPDGRTWMADNLNHAPQPGKSWCYDNENSLCGEYGRLYDWTAAKASCPEGWHLPSREEWGGLCRSVGGIMRSAADMDVYWEGISGRLKATSGWVRNYKSGTDDYGFSALPAGLRDNDGDFTGFGGYGAWWTASGYKEKFAYNFAIDYHSDRVEESAAGRGGGLSVRCIMDEGAPAVAADTNATAADPPVVYGTLTDSRDRNNYKTVKIGGATWMAENLKYAPSDGNSWCYGGNLKSADPECVKYGRMYDWATAMGINASYNRGKWDGGDTRHRGVCPAGWHLPSRGEWDNLAKSAGGKMSSDYAVKHDWLNAGTKLKSATGWNNNGNGTDNYGFSALAGGNKGVGGYGPCGFCNAGERGTWWTATERDTVYAYYRRMYHDNDRVDEIDYYKTDGRHVRCVMDESGPAGKE